jgi:hypothetical protein
VKYEEQYEEDLNEGNVPFGFPHGACKPSKWLEENKNAGDRCPFEANEKELISRLSICRKGLYEKMSLDIETYEMNRAASLFWWCPIS